MILHKTPTTIIYIHTYYWEKKIKAVVHALYWNCIDGKCSIKKEYHYFYVWTLKKMINKIPKTSTNGLFLYWIFFRCTRGQISPGHMLEVKCPGVTRLGVKLSGVTCVGDQMSWSQCASRQVSDIPDLSVLKAAFRSSKLHWWKM